MNPSVQHDDARFLDLLQRWQSGDFTRADEQELNTLAASDDFRREAMEGFMSLPEAAHDERLASLRLRLQKRVGGARLVTMPQILAAAAALILLLAAIWFFPKWNEKKDAPIAQTQVEPSEKNLPQKSIPTTESPDSERFDWTSTAAKPRSSASGPAQPAADGQSLSAPGAGSEIASVEEEIAVADDVQPNFSAAPPQAPNAAPITAKPQSEALDKASPEAKKEYAAASRTQENDKAKKSEAPTRTADSTWHETDRKPDMDAERKVARDELQTKESEPEDGWEAFNEYLRLNARLTPEARNNNTSGTVRLQFNINANGDPQGFIVLRSVGHGCDQEAIRLVRNWEWTRGQNPIVTVEVPFVR